MTQIDASPMPAGKASAKAETGVLRDRGRGGEADGDAGMEGGKPRFGDHWRSILSGDAGKPENRPASPDAGALAGDKVQQKLFGVLLRPPPVTLAAPGDGGGGKVSSPGIDAAKPGEVDISEVLAALNGAGVDAGDASVEVAGDDARGTPTELEDSDALLSAVIADADEGDSIHTADLRAATTGVTMTDPPARGAAIHPATAQPAATASAEAAAPAGAKTRTRGAATHAPVEKGSSKAAPDLHLATRADAARPATKATVLHQATHFAPALGGTNIQAISNALTEAAGDLRPGAERVASDPATRQPGARAAGPVKTLTIQLTPVSLGKITIEMRMSGGTMKVDIRVADPKALEMVRADKELIVNLLRKVGVAPDTITIQTTDNASSARQGQTGQGGANGSASDREASRDGSDGSGGNAGGEDSDQGRMFHDDRSTDQSRLRGDIYL